MSGPSFGSMMDSGSRGGVMHVPPAAAVPLAPGQAHRRAVSALLDEGWREHHPYKKWEGAHWRLLSLFELGSRADNRLEPMVDVVLAWLTGDRHRRSIVTLGGRVRRCASQEGNALLVATGLGFADDLRVQLLADSLVSWQWPDGGWNCDTRPQARHSSFHETLAPLRGLALFARSTGDRAALDAAGRAVELLLSHQLCRSRSTGQVIDREWLRIHWPAYWHYDVLQGLRAIGEAGHLARPEANEALHWLEEQRAGDGRWYPSGRRYWRTRGAAGSNTEVVDWEGLDSTVLTAQAGHVLRAAGGIE